MGKGAFTIELKVDDKGTATIKQFGKAVSKTGKSGKKDFDGMGKGLDKVNKKTASATSLIAKLGAAGLGMAALYAGFKTLNNLIGDSISLAKEQEAAERNLSSTLRATGEAAGYNLEQLKQMASGMQAVTTVGDEVILSGMSILATFKEVRGEGFERATMAALDMSEIMGQDLNSSIVQIGKALNDPILGMTALTRTGVTFTQQQKDMVKQLQNSGNMIAAQNVILDELESQFGGAAMALRDDFSGALTASQNALGDAKEELGFFVTKNKELKDVLIWTEGVFNSWIEQLRTAREEGGPLSASMTEMAKAFKSIGENVKDDVVPALTKTMTILATIAKYAGLRSITDTFFEGMELVKQGKIALEEFKSASFLVRQEMVDAAKAARAFGNGSAESIAKANAAYEAHQEKIKAVNKELKNNSAALEQIAGMDIDPVMFISQTPEDLKKIDTALKKSSDLIIKLNDKITKDKENAYKKELRALQAHKKKVQNAYAIMEADINSGGKKGYEYRKGLLEDERDYYIELTGDKVTADEWFHKRQVELWKDSDTISADIFNSITDNFKDAVDDMVDAFIAGEDMKQSVAEVTKDMLVNMAGDIAKKMFDKAIDGIIDLIAAHIGQGAAASGGAGATKGGALGALAEIGVFLGTGVAAMLAGRAAANQFRADGGWIARNQSGGWINEGSHVKDDVFLGATPGVRHWGMGGEFVVNQRSSRRHAGLLEAINRDHADGGPVIPWESTADALALGSGMSFVHGTYKGGGPASGLAEMIAYIVKVIPAMFLGKYMSDEFRADGGWINSNYGFGGFTAPSFSHPFGNTSPLTSPLEQFVSDITPPALQGLIPANPLDLIDQVADVGKDFLLDLIRAPLEQVARDLVTPQVYTSSPLAGIERTLKNAGDIFQDYMPSFAGGIDYLPTDTPAFLHQGEAVLTAEENSARNQPQTMHIHVYLDGKEISYSVSNQIDTGNIELIEAIRGIA